jgi:4-hydroxybenzoate polyprenyltransferase
VFLLIQLGLAFLILVQFNNLTILLGVACLGLVAAYPFMKRITYWPQAFLGLTMNWGVLLGWAAVNDELSLPPVVLYLGSFFWTLGYDTIYGHMDRKDDLTVGVKSTSILLGAHTRRYVFVWYVLFFCSFLVFGYLTNMGGLFFLGVSFIMVMLLYQILTLNIQNPSHCLRLFKINGFIGFVGVVALIWGK